MDLNPSQTAEQLRRLEPGQRAWFAFSPDLPLDETRLILRPLSEDPGREILDNLDYFLRSPGARIHTGIAFVDAQGQLSLGGTGLGAESLQRLTEWVTHHIPTLPDLARLNGAQLIAISADGVIEDRFTDDALWPAPSPPPPPEPAAEVLTALEPGQDAWLWISDAPAIRLQPNLGTTKPRHLIKAVQQQLRFNPSTQQWSGILRRTRERVIILTADPLDGLAEAVSALSQRPGLHDLQTVTLIETADGKFVSVRHVKARKPIGLQETVAAMSALSSDQEVWFWFTDADRSGHPYLLIDTDQGRLKRNVQAIQHTGQSIRGRLKVGSSGRVGFVARHHLAGFFPALIGWLNAHREHGSSLNILHHAIFIEKGSAQQKPKRHQDENAWTALIQDPTQ